MKGLPFITDFIHAGWGQMGNSNNVGIRQPPHYMFCFPDRYLIILSGGQNSGADEGWAINLESVTPDAKWGNQYYSKLLVVTFHSGMAMIGDGGVRPSKDPLYQVPLGGCPVSNSSVNIASMLNNGIGCTVNQ